MWSCDVRNASNYRVFSFDCYIHLLYALEIITNKSIFQL